MEIEKTKKKDVSVKSEGAAEADAVEVVTGKVLFLFDLRNYVEMSLIQRRM